MFVPFRKKISIAFALTALFVCLLVPLCFAVEAPRNPNSAKECAICHYRWIDTFFVDGRGSDLVEYQAVPVAAEAEICFSCHDGSVVDSRVRIFNDRRHKINKPPPPGMKIPKEFPLDKNGNMQCATCHTAHGVSSEMGIEKTIFLRFSNENSAMCIMCHSDKAGGPANGNHPINSTALTIPKELLAAGAVEGSKKNQVICETCHSVHGSDNENFLVASAKESGLCMVCHTEQALVKGTEHDLRITAAQSKNKKGKTTAQSGVCSSCHLVHGGGKKVLWARNSESGLADGVTLCIECHSEKGVANKKLVANHSHPVDLAPSEKGLATSLPLYDKKGNKKKKGFMTCQTCHDPHRWNHKGQPGTGKNIEGDSRNSFLRLENSPSPKLCADCHISQAPVARTDHDLLIAGPDSKNKQGQSPEESGVCGVCHLVHGGDKDFLWGRGLSRGKWLTEDLCLSCHVSYGPGFKKIIKKNSHPLDITPAQANLSTTLPLYNSEAKKDKKGIITCQTCHDLHRWNHKGEPGMGKNVEGDSQNSFLRLPNSPNPELCTDCHKDQSLLVKTDHDMLVTAPQSSNLLNQNPKQSGPCGACHAVHNAVHPLFLWAREFEDGDGILDEMCNSCHWREGCAKDKIPQTAFHPRDKLVTNIGRDKIDRPNFFPMWDRNSGKSVQVGDVACASCHNVHQWNPRHFEAGTEENLEGTASDSFLRPQTFDMVCKDCHGFDALFRFKYYHDSKKRGKPGR